MESKRNKTFGNVIFSLNMIQETWSRRQEIIEEATRQGARPPPGCALHPRGPLIAPPTYFFLLYISIYPDNIQEHHETLFPPPQPSVPKRSHLGAFSGAPPEGESITQGFYINTIASPMMCAYFTSDLRVHSYQLDGFFSLSLDLNTKFTSTLLEIYSM